MTIARRPGRSHPPSLLRLAERLIRDERLVARGEIVLCACSGGPDSTALLHVLARLRDRLGFTLVGHGVDHGLRPEAGAELGRAERAAGALGVPFATTRLRVEPGGNLQARAREARRGALRAAARLAGAHAVATGHTADDRAETFLMRLLRGSGPRGLAVMPPSAPLDDDLRVVRPLLTARRADVEAHLARHHLDVGRDPSNEDARFLRVRVRRELLPQMEDLSPAIVAHLCALADMLAIERSSAPASTPDPSAEAEMESWGRAQRLAVARAKKCERPVKVLLPGGREVVVGFSGEGPVLMGSSPRGARQPGPRGSRRTGRSGSDPGSSGSSGSTASS